VGLPGKLAAGYTSLRNVLETAVSEDLSVTGGEYYEWGPMTLILWLGLGGLTGTRWSLKCGDEHRSCCNYSTAFRRPGGRTQ
jgi:hypothetical protein